MIGLADILQPKHGISGRLGPPGMRAVRNGADQDRGLQRQGHRDHHPLALPARQVVGIAAQDARRVRQMDGLKQFGHAPADRLAMHLHDLGDLVADPHPRVQRRHRFLKDHAKARATPRPHLGRPNAQQVATFKADPTASDLQRLGQQPHDRAGRHRLARPALADDAQDLTGRHAEGHILDRRVAICTRRQRATVNPSTVSISDASTRGD